MVDPTAKVVAGMSMGFELRGQVYVRIALSERYPAKEAIHIETLARDLVLAPSKLLGALLSDHGRLRSSHGAVVEALFSDYGVVDGEGPGSLEPSERPSLTRAEKREVLRAQAFGVRAFKMFKDGEGGETTPRYYDWILPNDAKIIAPLSSGMVDVIERSRRWDAIEEDIEAFDRQLDELADLIIELKKALGELETAGTQGLHEVGMLVALAQYAELLLDQLGEPAMPHPVAAFATFLRASAIPVFIDKLVVNPVDIAPDAAKRRDRAARKILELLDDADFKAGAHVVLVNSDIIEHRVADRMFQFLAAAADLLSATDQADVFANRHALPAIRALESLPSDGFETELEAGGQAELAQGYASGLSKLLPDSDSVYKYGIGISSSVIGTVSNLEGPRSVLVALLFQYQRHMLERALASFRLSPGAYLRASEMFVRYFGDITIQQGNSLRAKLWEVIDERSKGARVGFQDALDRAGIKVTRGPLRGRRTRAAIGTLAIATALLAIATGSVENVYDVVGAASIGSTALIAVADMPAITGVLERKLGGKGLATLTKSAGLLSGVMTGVVALSSGAQLIEAYSHRASAGDLVEGALSTVGSAMSFAGWAWCARAGTFALTGTTLMTGGSVLVFAGVGVGIIRALKAKGPEELTKATLDELERKDSRAVAASLGPTVESLRHLAGDAELSPLDHEYEPVLRAMGYDASLIAVLRGKG